MEVNIVIGIGVSCVLLLVGLGTILYKLGFAIATSKTTQKFYEHNVPKLWEANTALVEKLQELRTDFEVYKVGSDDKE